MRRAAVLTIIVIIYLVCLNPSAWASDVFIWPVAGDVIKQFSPDEHRGVDISAAIGDTVVASQDGVIYWVGETPRGEPCVSIDHPNGVTTTYLPVKSTVAKGARVKAGDVIGTLSSEVDISSEVPHLHFGMFNTLSRENKEYIDPASILVSAGEQAVSSEEVVSVPQSSAGAVGLSPQQPPSQPSVVTPTIVLPALQQDVPGVIREGTAGQARHGSPVRVENPPALSTVGSLPKPSVSTVGNATVMPEADGSSPPVTSSSGGAAVKALVTRVSISPFEPVAKQGSIVGKSPVIGNIAAKDGSGIYNKYVRLPAVKFFGWCYLPNGIFVLVVLILALISVRYVRRTKSGGGFARSLTASC